MSEKEIKDKAENIEKSKEEIETEEVVKQFLPDELIDNYMEMGGREIQETDPSHGVKTFQILDQNNNMVNAEVLEVFDVDDKTFAIFKAPKVEGGDEYMIDACYVIRDSNGFDHISPINEKADMRMIKDYINSVWKEF